MSQLPVSILALLTAQLTAERYNSELYRAMGMAFESMNFPGMAAWMKKHSDEERGHADKIANYIADRGDYVEFEALDAVAITMTGTPPIYFKAALKAEQETTASLKEKYNAALTEDSQAAIFLQWFVAEQVEEEKVVEEICDMFQRAGAGLGYVIMDEKLGNAAK